MGGKPSKGTSADKRLKANKSKAVTPKPKTSTAAAKKLPFGGKQAPPFKKK